MKTFFRLFFTAVQFLTRIPFAPSEFYRDDLAKSLVFSPVVGLIIAAGGLLLHFVLAGRTPNDVIVVLVLCYLVLVTGGLHEDAIADAADGFGGGWNKEQTLTIMRDSRIGSYGAVAVVLSLLSRFVFLTELPATHFVMYFAAGLVLSRWTVLPLTFFMLPARTDSGQGSLVAGKVSWFSLICGTVLAAGIAALFLKSALLWAGAAALLVVILTGFYYHKRLGGITGDCIGATIQLAEISVYLTGVVAHG